MATEEDVSSSPNHSAQYVGNAFVLQYYHVLINYPHMAHKFYNESSTLSRPETDHETTPVTTIESIKEKIRSLNYKVCKVEITTVDAQYSPDKNGVIVLVTGLFIGKDNKKRKFTQTFYLARQTEGYYVANDIFRFLELIETPTSLIVNDVATENVPNSPLTSDKEISCISNQPMQNNVSPTDEVISNGREKKSWVVKGVVDGELRNSNETNVHRVAKQDLNVQKDMKKISYETNVHRVAKQDSNVQKDTKKISYETNEHRVTKQDSNIQNDMKKISYETNEHRVAKQDSNIQKDTKKISYETNEHRVAKKDSNIQNDMKKISYETIGHRVAKKDSNVQNDTKNISYETNEHRVAKKDSNVQNDTKKISYETNEHKVVKKDSNVQNDTKKISYEINEHRVTKKDLNVQNDTKKISYASMVLKESTKTSIDQQCTPNTVIVAPSSTNQEKCASAALKQSTPRSNSAAQTINTHKGVKAIFAGNLPTNASIEQVEEIFKTFGSIKKNGVQIRRSKDGFCYGFVEFELSTSAHKAIAARNIKMGLRNVCIAEKRDTNQGSDNGRFYNRNYNSWGNFVESRGCRRY